VARQVAREPRGVQAGRTGRPDARTIAAVQEVGQEASNGIGQLRTCLALGH